MRKYRLTVLFVITAVLVIAAATAIANHVIAGLAENNLTTVAEANTARTGVHILSMMRNQHSLTGASPHDHMDMEQGSTTGGMHEHLPQSLEDLTGPDGLPTHYSMMVEGLNIVELNLYDLERNIVWSNHPENIGTRPEETSRFLTAAAGGLRESVGVK